MRFLPKAVAAAALTLMAGAAAAGPPFDTDDPEPTDTGHWEIYDFAAGAGSEGVWDGSAGLDLNYGPVPGLQLTATLPVAFQRDHGFHAGAGDVELGVKYRFLHRDKAGFSIAAFPRLILPTAGPRFGTGRLRILLPLWAQKDFGGLSLFGGGGYTINPGPGNRDFWQQGIAITGKASKHLLLGAEITRQGPDTIGARGTAALGLGGIYSLGGPFSLLFSGGPQWQGSARGLHAYAALGLNF
jgi:hypothetical protein